MSEETKDQRQDLIDTREVIAIAVGTAIFVTYGLREQDDLLFGLVMASVYIVGLKLAVWTPARFKASVGGKLTLARLVGAFAVGIAAALIAAVVLAIVDPLSWEGDNILLKIIRRFFDSTTVIALLIGSLVGSLLHRKDSV